MSTYAIGDIQGCWSEFSALLEQVRFDPDHDRLWLVGDLVNRGPDSLEVLRFAHGLGDACRIVLGNHDLHLLATWFGGRAPRRSDTFADVLTAPDAERLCEWLRRQPLLVVDETLGFAMTHAGIPHIWDLDQARARAAEVETVLGGDDAFGFFAGMYGNEPDLWHDQLEGLPRQRLITNYFTRMRLVDDAGRLDLESKEGPAGAAPPWYPWYELRQSRPLGIRLLFGHWAALEGLTDKVGIVGLDTGCVWGGPLTALCLESGEFSSIPAR